MIKYSINRCKDGLNKWIVFKEIHIRNGFNIKGVYKSNNYTDCKIFIQQDKKR